MDSDRWGRLPEWGPTLLRLIAGFMFFMYGWDKFFGLGRGFWTDLFDSQGIPLASSAVVLVAIVEFVGGAALVVGLFTRWAAALLTIDMVVAILVVGLDGGFWVWNNGASFPLAMLAGVVPLVLMGLGEASLDRLIGGRLPGSMASTGNGTVPRAR